MALVTVATRTGSCFRGSAGSTVPEAPSRVNRKQAGGIDRSFAAARSTEPPPLDGHMLPRWPDGRRVRICAWRVDAHRVREQRSALMASLPAHHVFLRRLHRKN
ncbi:hypothetical protein [Streptomyces sp. SLBN-8D4]|jgi:hypothetical protein|uniref:hypothetical protein n=1 Tax=Streptomyces sp. SLBN-8D4 TaxID=3377728 RepID=UPI003C7A16E6